MKIGNETKNVFVGLKHKSWLKKAALRSFQTKALFQLIYFCTKTERKTSVSVKVFTLIRIKLAQKRCPEWKSIKIYLFKNTEKLGECAKLNVFENKTIQEQYKNKSWIFHNVFLADGNRQKQKVSIPFCTKTK